MSFCLNEQICVTLSLARKLARQETSAIRGAIKLTTPSLFVKRIGVDEATAAITAAAEQTARGAQNYRSASENLPFIDRVTALVHSVDLVQFVYIL